jgi:hypothetical protein
MLAWIAVIKRTVLLRMQRNCDPIYPCKDVNGVTGEWSCSSSKGYMYTELPWHPALPFLDTHPNEVKTCIHTKTCTQMFTGALFIIAKGTNKPNVHRLIIGNKMFYNLIIHIAIKGLKCYHMLGNGWPLKILCLVKKKASHQDHNLHESIDMKCIE